VAVMGIHLGPAGTHGRQQTEQRQDGGSGTHRENAVGGKTYDALSP
jgi:hypothetical protein